jgi:MHS family proline/betaine transporter-like MFS transporter
MTRSVQADGKVVYTQTSLTREQKEAVGLLSIGTILEYFDLMLYVHMAVLLNELFFEPTNPESAGFMTAIAFCSSFVFRPVGAVIFGWLGDNFGRKTTIVITTFLMALSCIMMAILPTYAQIGFAATVGVTLCRIVQSISSMGEVVGAKLYLTELLSPPIQYPVVTLIQAFAAFGGLLALGVATIVTSLGFDWRNAFWIGQLSLLSAL